MAPFDMLMALLGAISVVCLLGTLVQLVIEKIFRHYMMRRLERIANNDLAQLEAKLK